MVVERTAVVAYSSIRRINDSLQLLFLYRKRILSIKYTHHQSSYCSRPFPFRLLQLRCRFTVFRVSVYCCWVHFQCLKCRCAAVSGSFWEFFRFLLITQTKSLSAEKTSFWGENRHICGAFQTKQHNFIFVGLLLVFSTMQTLHGHFLIGRISISRWRCRFDLANQNSSVGVRRRLDIHHSVAACHRRPTTQRAGRRPASDQSTGDLSCRQ